MDQDRYERAKKIEKRIRHIDDMIKFLTKADYSTSDIEGQVHIKIPIFGFDNKRIMSINDVETIIYAFEDETKRLNKEFEML